MSAFGGGFGAKSPTAKSPIAGGFAGFGKPKPAGGFGMPAAPVAGAKPAVRGFGGGFGLKPGAKPGGFGTKPGAKPGGFGTKTPGGFGAAGGFARHAACPSPPIPTDWTVYTWCLMRRLVPANQAQAIPAIGAYSEPLKAIKSSFTKATRYKTSDPDGVGFWIEIVHSLAIQFGLDDANRLLNPKDLPVPALIEFSLELIEAAETIQDGCTVAPVSVRPGASKEGGGFGAKAGGFKGAPEEVGGGAGFTPKGSAKAPGVAAAPTSGSKFGGFGRSKFNSTGGFGSPKSAGSFGSPKSAGSPKPYGSQEAFNKDTTPNF